MPTDSNGLSSPISRRTALKAGVAGGVAVLAGCTTDDGGPVGDPVEERVEQEFRVANHRGAYEFETAHWNPYDPNNSMADFDPPGLLYDPYVVYLHSADETRGVIAQDWQMDGETLDMELRDDYTWHNGDDVVAQDYATQWNIDLELSRILSDNEDPNAFIDEAEAIDDHLIRFHLHDEFGENFIMANAIGNDLNIIKSDLGDDRTYAEWLEALRNTDGDEREQVASDLLDWNQENPVGNGVFELDTVGDNTMHATLYEDHPNAENVLFTDYVWEQYENQHLAFQEGQVDGITVTLPAPTDVEQQLPDYHKINGDYLHYHSVLFNFGNYDIPASAADDGAYDPYTDDRNFRKAIAYAVNRESVAQTAPGDSYQLIDLPPCWLTEEAANNGIVDLDGYDHYETDLDAAHDHMEAAGYDYDEGDKLWYDDNGDTIEIILMANTGSGIQRNGLNTINHELEEFGLDPDLQIVDEATYGNRRLNGEYDILLDDGGGFSVRGIMWIDAVWNWYSELMHVDWYNDSFEVPMPIGDPSGSDGTEEMVLGDELGAWHRTGDDDEYLQRLTWMYNQVLPQFEVVAGLDHGGIRADHWHVDGPDEIINNRVAEYNLLKLEDAELIPYEQ